MSGKETRVPILGAMLVFAGLIGLIALCAESAAVWYGADVPSARRVAYIGGAGALGASLCGLPFLIRLARIDDPDETGRFWKLWGLGLATRTGVGLLVAVVLIYWFPPPVEAGVLTLALTYFVALMIETVWVAVRLSRQQ